MITSLEPLEGMKLEQFPHTDLKLIRHLEWYDGPLFVEYRNSQDEIFLYDWCDTDNESVHRWMVFRVTESQYHYYARRKSITLFELLKQIPDQYVYFLDLDNDGITKDCVLVQATEIPEAYLPEEDSYYVERGLRGNEKIMITRSQILSSLSNIGASVLRFWELVYRFILKQNKLQLKK